MSVAKVHKAIYSVLDSTGYTVCSGLRTAGTETPCMVYEINSAELAVQMRGVSALNHWTIGLQIACVADSVDSVCDMIDAVLDEFNAGPINSGTNSVSISVSSFSVGFTTETPDDGKHDAERVGTITMNLLVQED